MSPDDCAKLIPKIEWWKWPKNKYPTLAPWYVIVRRIVFFPLFMLGKVFVFLAVLGSYGLDDAKELWEDLR